MLRFIEWVLAIELFFATEDTDYHRREQIYALPSVAIFENTDGFIYK